MNLKYIIREEIYKALNEDEYDDRLQSKIEDSDLEYDNANKACGETHRAIERISNQQKRLRNWRNNLSMWKQLISQKRYAKLQDRLHNNLKNELMKNSQAAIKRDKEALRGGHLKGFKNDGIRISNLDEF